jgi:hypothetical protein
LHSLRRPVVVPWPALHNNYAGATRLLKHFKPVFAREIQAALAAYRDARVDMVTEGARLSPSPPPTGSILRAVR